MTCVKHVVNKTMAENVDPEDTGASFNMGYMGEDITNTETSFNEQDYGEANYDDDYNDINLNNIPDIPEFDPNVNWDNRGGFRQEPIEKTATKEKPKSSLSTAEKRTQQEENFKTYAKGQRLKISLRRKKFFKTNFNQQVVMKDGPESKKLIEKSLISVNVKTLNEDGIIYDEKKVIVRKGKGFALSTNKALAKTVLEFETLMEKAREEHEKTANSTIEKEIGSLPGTYVVNKIRKNAADVIHDDVIIMGSALYEQASNIEGDFDSNFRNLTGIINDVTDSLNNPDLSPENRKMLLNSKIESSDINKNLYNDKATAEKNPQLKLLWKSFEKIFRMMGDEFRMLDNQKPQEEETEEIIRNLNLTRFERFKVWAKENMGVTAALAISVAGIITTIVIGTSKGVVTAAKATGALAKALAKVGKAALPALVPLLSILATVLSWGAKGLAFLAKNLWLLAIGISYIMYTEYNK